MPLEYKYFPEKKLLIEYSSDTLSIDNISSNLLEFEYSEKLKGILYYLSDYRNLKLNFTKEELKRISKTIEAFSHNFKIRQWVIIYKTEEDKKSLETILEAFLNHPKSDIRFFPAQKAKEAYMYLGIKDIFE